MGYFQHLACHFMSFWGNKMGHRRNQVKWVNEQMGFLNYWFWVVLGFAAAVSRGYSSLWCTGFSLQWLLQLQNTGSRHLSFSSCNLRALECGLSSCVHRLSCSVACGISPDQGSNPCPLHWQTDSYPLYHQGSPGMWAFPASTLMLSITLCRAVPCSIPFLW